jgi:hypothetical protein
VAGGKQGVVAIVANLLLRTVNNDTSLSVLPRFASSQTAQRIERCKKENQTSWSQTWKNSTRLEALDRVPSREGRRASGLAAAPRAVGHKHLEQQWRILSAPVLKNRISPNQQHTAFVLPLQGPWQGVIAPQVRSQSGPASCIYFNTDRH